MENPQNVNQVKEQEQILRKQEVRTLAARLLVAQETGNISDVSGTNTSKAIRIAVEFYNDFDGTYNRYNKQLNKN